MWAPQRPGLHAEGFPAEPYHQPLLSASKYSTKLPNSPWVTILNAFKSMASLKGLCHLNIVFPRLYERL